MSARMRFDVALVSIKALRLLIPNAGRLKWMMNSLVLARAGLVRGVMSEMLVNPTGLAGSFGKTGESEGAVGSKAFW